MCLPAYATAHDLTVSFTIYCDSPIRDVSNTTNCVFYLRNLHGTTLEEQVAYAAEVMDEVAVELHHLTKLGIAGSVVKAGTRKVHALCRCLGYGKAPARLTWRRWRRPDAAIWLRSKENRPGP